MFLFNVLLLFNLVFMFCFFFVELQLLAFFGNADYFGKESGQSRAVVPESQCFILVEFKDEVLDERVNVDAVGILDHQTDHVVNQELLESLSSHYSYELDDFTGDHNGRHQ